MFTSRWSASKTVFLTCVLALGGFGAADAGDMLISSFLGGEIMRYDATTGVFVNYYIPDTSTPHGIMLGPDCNLYVASAATNAVLRFSTTTEPNGDPLPSSTGAPGSAQFVAPGAGGLSAIGSSDFGPDGDLYVASGNSVLRFDGTTGAFIDEFVTAGSGGLLGAALLHFGDDGDLYVPDTANNGVLRFDGATGAPKPGPFGDPGTAEFVNDPTLAQVHDFDFGPNGNLYVADYTGDQIMEFDGLTGALVSLLVPAGSGYFPHGITFGPDGTFFTTSLGTEFIHHFDVDGTYLGLFIDGRGLFSGASDIVFPAASCGAPVVVPDGSLGTEPLTAERLDAVGDSIQATWDVTTCQATGYHLLYGSLGSVSAYSLDGALCDLGGSGSATWAMAPAGSTWFLIVGDDGAGTEGGWGFGSGGADRNGATSSGMCGNSARNNAGSCPPGG